ncbi:GntR family transcriptional regulator [Ferrimonas senticii]|uniref:GntR family transcriptional regulator n=1 Tax=Ferrimonas senticii TaxID=394566 RepID=UPI0004005F13|nr:GntR family transcriptional regulator [Ferrimonas senticii]
MVNQESINKSEQAYDVLEQMIIFRELKPGSMVSEKQLAENLGLGRTPVREALQRLSYERMVEIHPRRGIQIPVIALETQLKILEVRREVEALCLGFATERADEREKRNMLQLADELEACAKRGDERAYAERLKQIHTDLVRVAGNEFVQLAMAPLQGLSRRFWFAYKDGVADLQQAAHLHAQNLRQVASGNKAAAIAASHQLNDYLTKMAYASINRKISDA